MAFYNSDDLDDEPQVERQESFAGGVDNYRRSTLLDADQSQEMVNIIVRDNWEAWTRPGADPFSPRITAAPIRSLRFFDTPNNTLLCAVCNGALSVCSGANQAWQPVNYAATNSSLLVEMEQGLDTLLLSDGLGALASISSTLEVTTHTQDPNVDPPVGATILCWHTGRMFAAGFSGGISGKARDAIWVSTLLAFGNGCWNGTTRSFRVGDGDGESIVALHSLQGTTLAVFKTNSVWTVNTDPTAEPANFSTGVIPQPLGFGVGCVSKWAVTGVGNDVFFMAQDGVRSLQRMEAAVGQWELSAPISQPVQQYINRINPSARSGITATTYNEFVLFAVPLDQSAVNNAVLVYNTRLSRWLGCWTGWTPTRFAVTRFNGVSRLMFSDTVGFVNLWKDAGDSGASATYLDNGSNIPCVLTTRSLQFQQPVNSKNPYSCILYFTAGNAAATIAAYLDLAQSAVFGANFAVSGSKLGIGTLPFTLASVKPVKVQKSLRNLGQFQELYLRIQSTSGWFKLRNITVTAFVNPMAG